MKNITVTIENELYRRARIIAAERNTSVTALVRDYLRALQPGDAHAARVSRLNAVLGEIRGGAAAKRLSRDQAHERSRLR